MSRTTDLDRLDSRVRHLGLSRREFFERAAKVGFLAGAATLGGTPLFAQAPQAPTNVRIGIPFTAASGLALTGSIGDGQILTVTKAGGGFGTKPYGAAPLYWFPFESDLSLSPLSRYSGSLPNFVGAFSSSNPATGSLGSLLQNLAAFNAGQPNIGNNMFDSASGGGLLIPLDGVQRLYAIIKRNNDFNTADVGAHNPGSVTYGISAGDFNFKFFRADPIGPYGSSYPASSNGADAGCNTNPANATLMWAQDTYQNGRGWIESPYLRSYDTNWIDYPPGNTSGTFETYAHQYVSWEFLIDEGTLGNQDGVFQWWLNGRSILPLNLTWKFRDSNNTAWTRHIAFDQVYNWFGNYTANAYTDYIYVDDSWCRVVLSDETTFNTTLTGQVQPQHVREIQIPTAWTDTSISFQFRSGCYRGNLSGKCIYVISQDGTAVKVGTFA
jgi:hypothetical protein